MTVDQWIEACQQDAGRRRLPEVVAMLDTLAQASRALRSADWNPDPAGPSAAPRDPGPSGAAPPSTR
jgi:hypothetical protein